MSVARSRFWSLVDFGEFVMLFDGAEQRDLEVGQIIRYFGAPVLLLASYPMVIRLALPPAAAVLVAIAHSSTRSARL